jgi:hypothetical protein
MANVKKFLFIDSTGQQKEQTALDTLQVADGVNASDVVNKGQLDAAALVASDAVATEEARALAAEAVLQSAIDGVAADLAGEVSRAMSAEQAIAGDLAQEITDRQAAITSLSQSLSADILAEQTRAQGVEAGLASDISAETSARVAAVLAEKTRAEGVEADLLSAINTEITDRTAAVSGEASARAAAVSAEQSRAEGVEASLQSQITQEIADRESAITSLSSTLSAAITAEETARISADAFIQGQLDIEIARAEGAESQLATDLSAERSRALAAESALSSSIATEVSDRQAAVSAEESRAMAAESGLASDIAGETSARISAVSAEESARIAGDDALAADLATETSDRIAGDAATLADAKLYADGLVSGITFKNSVRVALPWQFDMGGMVTLPADFMTIKGPAGLDAGDRVLLVNKDDGTTSVNEGIYVVNSAGTALVRAPDMIVGSDASGVLTYVEEGVLGSDLPFATPGTSFVCANVKGGDIVGTDALDFAVFSRAEALSFTKGTKKEGLNVSLAFASGAPFVQDSGLDLVIDSTFFKKDAGSLTMQGSLVQGTASSADHLHIHKHAAVVKACSVASGAFVKPDCTSATWNSPAVMGMVESDGSSAGEKVIVVAGMAGEGLSGSALSAFSVGDVVYLGGSAGEFAAFADVPSGKYAVPVGRKVGATELVVQIGGAPTLKA